MHHVRLVLALLAAAALSLAVGLIVTELTGLMPCQGEQLACNIDAAVGAYAVIIWAALGPLVFGVTLFVAQNRIAAAGAAAVLLAPLLVGYALILSETLQTVGVRPYSDLRRFLVMLLPPIVTVLVQWLAMRWWLGRQTLEPRAAKPDHRPPQPREPVEPPRKDLGSIPFPTE